jgi:undecaprenyl pyrophosphate synthase
MAYIFLDESGDLGFDRKKRSSKYFIITFLFCNEKRPIEKIVKLAHSSLKKIHKQKSGVLHCYHEKPITRTRLLTKLAQKDIKIMTVYVNKNKVYTRLHKEKDVLYNFVTNILLDRICTKKLIPKNENIELIASRKETNKFLNTNFRNYLSAQVKSNHKLDINIEIKTPHEEKALQAVDFLSWSIFRKYEQDDESYYEIFKSKIYEENILFK